MGKGGRRNPRQKTAYFIKAFASYHGNLCVHLQDADTSQKLEHALENLKIDRKSTESFPVGTNVLVAVTESGKRKFRRAEIDTNGVNSVDATDLDTNEYYTDIESGNVYNISHLGNTELIEAPGAQPYYVFGFHTSETVVNPKKFDKALRAAKGVRWLFEKTGEKHFIEEETCVIKLFKENKNCTKEIFSNIRAQPRGMRVMPALFCGSIEEVRVNHSAETMGVQLRYLPLHELRRLEVLLTEGLTPETLKTCDAASTQENQLVAASYDGRMVRGLVVEVRPTGANVFLMDYGIYKRFRFPALRHLHPEFASKLPRYGLCVKLAEEPDDYFDDRIIKVELKAEIDEFTWQGSIVEIVDDVMEESPEREETDVGAGAAKPDVGDRGQPVADLAVEESEENAADPPEEDISLPRELASYIDSTNEEFVGSNDESVSSPAVQTSRVNPASGNATISGEAANEVGIDCAGPSSTAPDGSESSEAPACEDAVGDPVCLEQIFPSDESVPTAADNTEDLARTQLVSQGDVTTANDGIMPPDDGIELLTARGDVENVDEFPHGNDQKDAGNCPDPAATYSNDFVTDSSGVVNTSDTEQPDVRCPLDEKSQNLKDLPTLEEPPFDADSSRLLRTDERESEVENIGAEDRSGSDEAVAVRNPQQMSETKLQDSDTNPPEVVDEPSVECIAEENPPNPASLCEEKSEAINQLEQLSETPSQRVATPTDVGDAATSEMDSSTSEIDAPLDAIGAPMNEVEVPTADVGANTVPTLAAEALENDLEHGTDENTCAIFSETTTDADTSEEPIPGTTQTTECAVGDTSTCDENLEVLEAQSGPEVPIACSPTEAFADDNVEPDADPAVATDHMTTAEQQETNILGGVDLVVEPGGIVYQVPEDVGAGDFAENQNQLIEENAKPENSGEISAQPDVQAPVTISGRGDGSADEVQSGNVASLEDISHTLQGTDHALIVQFGPSRSRKPDAPCHENTLKHAEGKISEPVTANIREALPVSTVDNKILPPESTETKIAATTLVDSAPRIGNQTSQVHAALFSDERPTATMRRGLLTGATNQGIGLQSEDFPEALGGTLSTTFDSEPLVGQFDDAVEDVPAPEVGHVVGNDVANGVGIEIGPDTVSDVESVKPMSNGGDSQLASTDAVDTREEPVPDETRQVSVNDALPATSTAGDQTSRTSESSSYRLKEVEIEDDRNSKIYPAAVREFCDFPLLSFDLERVLIAKVIRVVNSRNVLMRSDVILASIEEQLNQISNPLPDTYIKPGKTVLVEHNGKLSRACIAEPTRGRPVNSYHVYLLDYSVCLSNPKLYRCPPVIGAMPRALLFVKLMGRQLTRADWVGKYFSLLIDRFEGSVINGIVLRDPNRNYEAALPPTQISGTQASGKLL